MCRTKRELGNAAEDRAVKFLLSQNYQLITRNFFYRTGEIDVITYDQLHCQIVFVEVKSLKNEDYISITQTISQAKKRKIIKTCLYWLQKHGKINHDWRIDFIGIVLDNSNVVHIQSAIY
jgi:putative endonuclease